MESIYGAKINGTEYSFEDETKVPYDLLTDTIGQTRKNLIPYPYDETTRTENGITYTDNGDGTITASGTATATSFFRCRQKRMLSLTDGEKYILSSSLKNTIDGCNLRVRDQNDKDVVVNDSGDSYFTAKSSEQYRVIFRITQGTTVSNLTFKPMLRKADIIDNTYEPYMEQTVLDQIKESKEKEESLANNIIANTELLKDTVGWTGKNLLIQTVENYVTTTGISVTVNLDKSITLNGTVSSSVELSVWLNEHLAIEDGTYILSGEIPEIPNFGLQMFNEGGWNLITADKRTSNGQYEKNAHQPTQISNGTYRIRVQANAGTVLDNVTLYPMLRKADILDDTYEPYHISLTPVLGNLTDIIDEVNGVNLLIYPYNDTTKTINGITFTDNGDGSVTLNGTCEENGYFNFNLVNTSYDKRKLFIERVLNKNVIASINIPAEYSDILAFQFFNYNGNGSSQIRVKTESQFVITNGNTIANAVNVNIQILNGKGRTFNNLTLYPMLRLASIDDSTYRPYNERSVKNQLATMQNELGAKNLLPFLHSVGSYTVNGLTYVTNSDGSVTTSGTATITPTTLEKPISLEPGEYILSGCPSGGGNNYKLDIIFQNSESGQRIMEDVGSGKRFKVYDTDTSFNVRIRFSEGTNGDGLTFYPMIRPASISDDTYTPYTKTNRELTEDVKTEELVKLVDNTFYSNKCDMEVGNLFVGKFKTGDIEVCKSGKIVTVKVDIQLTEDVTTGTWENGTFLSHLPKPLSIVTGIVGYYGSGEQLLYLQFHFRNNIPTLEFIKTATIPNSKNIKLSFAYITND